MIERLENLGRSLWALDTGLEPQGLEAAALVKQVRAPAWFFDGTWTSWPIQGVMEHRGTLWVYGPDLGDFLPQGWDTLPLEEEQNRVIRFLEALENAPDHRGPWLCLDHHRFLVLPEYFNRRDNPSLRAWKAFGSPETEASRDREWRAGALVWRLYSGSFPYATTFTVDDEIARDRQREIRLPPAAWVFPHLSGDLATVLDASLDFSRKETGLWKGWSHKLPLPGAVPVEDGKILGWKKSQERRLAARIWWRRHRLRASLAITGSLILSMLFTGLFLSQGTPGQPDLRPPRDVVQSYYDTINDIRDRPLRELTKGSRDPVLQMEADEMARLFIFSELQITQIGGPGVLSARIWEEADRPALGNYQTLFGLTDLDLREIPSDTQTPGQATWEAVYRRWYSTQEQEGGLMLPRTWDVRQVRDRLHLNLTPEGWKIHRLERAETPIPMEGLGP